MSLRPRSILGEIFRLAGDNKAFDFSRELFTEGEILLVLRDVSHGREERRSLAKLDEARGLKHLERAPFRCRVARKRNAGAFQDFAEALVFFWSRRPSARDGRRPALRT